MIGMHMRDDNAINRCVLGQVGKYVFPDVVADISIDASIDNVPAAIGFEQPQIDVAQCEWQRHSQPVDAGGDWYRCADIRRLVNGVLDRVLGFRFLHGCIFACQAGLPEATAQIDIEFARRSALLKECQ